MGKRLRAIRYDQGQQGAARISEVRGFHVFEAVLWMLLGNTLKKTLLLRQKKNTNTSLLTKNSTREGLKITGGEKELLC